ncbi:MAG: hypothetical protein M3R22_10435 [Pseudomonadota bacterium]|nr:hypothetical protein [Pseudomonadota bacterium]
MIENVTPPSRSAVWSVGQLIAAVAELVRMGLPHAPSEAKCPGFPARQAAIAISA